jgi:hypothetical protein
MMIRNVMRASFLERKRNPGYVDHDEELLKIVGVKSWSDLRERAGCGDIDDNDSGTLDFTPLQPDGAGYSGVKKAKISIPIDSSPDDVGTAFSELVRKSLEYARL